MVEEGEGTETYLYLSLSESRFHVVRSGGVGLREAFEHPEDGFIFQVTANYESGENDLKMVAPDDLPPEWLPTDAAVLQLPTETRPPFRSEGLAEEASSEGRALLAIEVDPLGILRTELPLRSLSRLAGSLQDVIDALAQEEVGRPTDRGMIPGDILRETELVFSESRAASFVLIAGSASFDNRLIPSPTLEGSCRRLVILLQQGADPDGLRSLVSRYGPRARAKYRALLEALTDDSTGISAYLATPLGDSEQATLKPAEIRRSLDLLRDIGTEVMAEYLERVHLVGVNLRTGSFEVYDPDTHKKYSGYMDAEARGQIEGLPTGFDHFYSARILVQQQFSNISDEITKTYRLISIGAPYGSSIDPVIQPAPSSEEASA